MKLSREREILFLSNATKLIFVINQFEDRLIAFFAEICPHLFFPLPQPQTKSISNSRLYSEEYRKLKKTNFILRYVCKIPARSGKNLPKVTYPCFYSCLSTPQVQLSTGLGEQHGVCGDRGRMRAPGSRE